MVIVFLPAYNEEKALPRLLRKFIDVLTKYGEPYRILVYDDGSKDSTVKMAQGFAIDYPVEVQKHAVNQGLGRTLIDGFKHLQHSLGDDDFVVTMDCDDTHEPKYLPEAFQKMKEGYDIVILSRFQKGGGQEGLSGLKTFLSMGAGIFLKILFPMKGIREYSCNYRVYRGSILKKAHRVFGDKFIRLDHMGFVATPEILIKLRMLKARIGEVPFVLRYDQKPTKSANKSLKTIRGYFALAWLYFGRKAPQTPQNA